MTSVWCCPVPLASRSDEAPNKDWRWSRPLRGRNDRAADQACRVPSLSRRHHRQRAVRGAKCRDDHRRNKGWRRPVPLPLQMTRREADKSRCPVPARRNTTKPRRQDCPVAATAILTGALRYCGMRPGLGNRPRDMAHDDCGGHRSHGPCDKCARACTPCTRTSSVALSEPPVSALLPLVPRARGVQLPSSMSHLRGRPAS